MKKIILIAAISIGMIFTMAACGVRENNKKDFEQYDFYEDSIEKIEDKMDLDEIRANGVFKALIEIGLDDEIEACASTYDLNDDLYYVVEWNDDYVGVYLTAGGSVDKITKDGMVIYEDDKKTSYEETLKPVDEPSSEDIFPNSNEMVGYLIDKANYDVTFATTDDINNAVNWLKDNAENCFKDNETMEKTMYYGALLEAKYTGTGNNYEKAGWQAIETVKYVYRGLENVSDSSTQRNFEKLIDLVDSL